MAHTLFENVVLSDKVNDILTTSVDLKNYMTVDTSMTETAGMKKTINVYTPSGTVEDLEMGSGNTEEITVSFTPESYDVKTTQGKFQYYDEQAMQDPNVVDVGLRGLTQTMVNDFTTKAIAEYGKATLQGTVADVNAITFDEIVDAIAKMNLEDEAGLFMLINPAQKAGLRKSLKEALSYSEGYVRTGYIGSVAGVPVIVSKAVPEDAAYLATNDAVTLFIKKDTEVEPTRDADKRNNIIFIRKYAVVALTDKTKVVKLAAAAAA